MQVYDSELFRFRVGGGNYLFNGLVPRVYNPLLLLDLNAVFIKLVSITKQVNHNNATACRLYSGLPLHVGLFIGFFKFVGFLFWFL